ncbi:hypothetical protein [Pyrobaculum calidifontis]|uniref:Family 577 protein n=1 Tax=Pyrobaculum calidifontis (strain DSM 21063 / JCM 11548 / VA1) TaxID=410359 RepID=A3MWS8_PYRCJ|nr:hypothetical protein [Pyrobaculum calidifontis]ABO09095.1 conserved hypothetical protein [Pyrobaculum calidifontis JCM 11548]
MRFVEEINVLRYYKPFIEAAGGVGQVKRALGWSTWYAVKWWDEVFSDIGLSSIRESVFARALYISLKIRGYVREDGHIKKRPEKPEYPTNSYAIEFVELHESFDRIGAVNVATNRADENTISIVYSTMLSQGWYKILRRTFLQLVGIERHQVIFEPIVKEGHDAMAVLEMHKPKLYIGFDYRRDNLELAAATLGVKPGECTKGICLIHASTICDAVHRIRNIAPWGVDAVLLLHTLYWLIDPVRELQCVAAVAGKNTQLLVGQQVVESTPGLLAMVVAMGAKHVFSWKGVENTLKAAGFSLQKRYLAYTPYYIAIWGR